MGIEIEIGICKDCWKKASLVEGICPVCTGKAKIQALELEIARLREELIEARAFAHQDGLADARKGIHELFVGEDSLLDGLEGDLPFCRFQEYSDSGDDSVGIPARAYWALSEDQVGTELERLLTASKQPT